MPVPVTVIIPTLNEEDWIAGAVESAFAADAAEVIVVDGGSFDRTARFATGAGARVLLGERLRARQLNRGVQAASNPSLIFLHADTRLPRGAAQAVDDALARDTTFGAFRLRFAEDSWKLRIAETMINARSRLLHTPWGDQGQFIARASLLAGGGFREIPIMEDYDLARRMKASTRILPLSVTTSGRRFLRNGLWRTAILNWKIIWRFHHGADPEDLAKMYRG
jgi:rSAM/selenodomain-associated transferase 2